MKLFLKGDRCFKDKCAFERRGYPPGQHGRRRIKVQDYGIQLREKQKVKRTYGVLERQFRNYFAKSAQMKGITGETLLKTLERRMDNVVYRLGYAESRAQARLLVTHGHFNVNGRRTDVPSMLVSPGDEIEVREGSKKRTYFKDVGDTAEARTLPRWLERDLKKLSGTVTQMPERRDVDMTLNESLIVEYYSR